MPGGGGASGARRTGGCLCGGVRFAIGEAARLRPLIACHCATCRKLSGSFFIATKVGAAQLSFSARETLAWYDSSDRAERGFCSRCGSLLFYRRKQQPDRIRGDSGSVSIAFGSLDEGNDLPFAGHIFAARADPLLDRLSTTPRCARWGEPPLVEALHRAGWRDTAALTGNPDAPDNERSGRLR